MARIEIPVAMMEFDEDGHTIWVHSPKGGTVLRIKTLGRITVSAACQNITPHVDIIVKKDIHICVPDDATATVLDDCETP